MSWKAVIMATGLYITVGTATVAYVPINVPHPAGPCLQEQELSKRVRELIKITRLEEVPDRLLEAGLATHDPRYNWCAPWWMLNASYAKNYLRGTTDEIPAAVPEKHITLWAKLPPKRPAFLHKHVTLEGGETK